MVPSFSSLMRIPSAPSSSRIRLARIATSSDQKLRAADVGVSVDTTPGFEHTLIVRALDFYRQEHYLLQGDALVKLDVPVARRPRVRASSSSGPRACT